LEEGTQDDKLFEKRAVPSIAEKISLFLFNPLPYRSVNNDGYDPVGKLGKLYKY
jgi:hypothetical protein